MNRTRKIVAAGIGTAVILAIVAIMLMAPPLHTQTPVSAAPPSNGGAGNGGANGTQNGGGSGAGNTTTPSCNQTADDHEWDDQNETDTNGTSGHEWGNGTETNDVAGTHEDGCTASSGDHDAKGDQESQEHASPRANLSDPDEPSGDVLAFAMGLAGWIVSLPASVVSSVRLVVGSLAGPASGSPVL